jgi:hypothetical protein
MYEPMRFVILRHDARDGTHWDLMLDRGAFLATWRLASPPVRLADDPIAATRIGAHRREYLDYEGPVSCDRGTVTRYDEGTYRDLRVADGRWELEFDGRHLAGPYSLSANGLPDAPDWTLRRL